MTDNLRWDALELREGDIVISAPSKCGMTWTQRLVSLLVFDGPDLPGPMSTVSPWLDHTIRPIEEVVATLDAQKHRRFIKTHTPLDGLKLDDRVTYIGVGRDPRDAAVSMLFQSANVDPDRMRALQRAAGPSRHATVPPHDRHDRRPATVSPHDRHDRRPDTVPPHERFTSPGTDVGRGLNRLEAFRHWLEAPILPPEQMGSLATVLHHFGSAWHRRHLPNVAVFHYADYQADLAGELVRLGRVLGFDLGRDRAEKLALHAGLDAMRARASQLAPNAVDGMWRSDEQFFRAGGRGEWREIFTDYEYRRYHQRATQLARQDLLAWAHQGRRGHDPAR